jgi:hypothetical protein
MARKRDTWGEARVLDATTGEELARTSYTAQF